MISRIKSQTEVSVVTLEEAKRQLNIVDNDADDIHIQLLIDVSTDLAQRYTRRMFSKGIVELVISGEQSLILPYGEVTDDNVAITAKVTGDDVGFNFEEISQTLTFDDGAIESTDRVIVEFEAGYANNDVPKAIKMGILMIISSLYENREDTVVGLSVNDIPLSSTSLLDAYQLGRIL